MAMEYFRRPFIVGNNLHHLDYATIRGSVRRSDADIDSPVPYYPGINTGDALQITLDTGVVNVSLPSNSYADILAAITTALGANGVVTDTDGVITIATNTSGSAGFIEITGGTSSALIALGFDLLDGVHLRSVGGDIPTSPEGRNGNWMGTACPGLGENFSMEAVSRLAGRVATNADVLYSDIAKAKATFCSVGSITSTPVSGHLNHGYYTLPTTTSVLTDSLSKDSAREQVAAYFLVLDNTTYLPAASQVVGVVRGVPTHVPGDVAFVNTASWIAADGGNVLGMSLLKVSSQSITQVKSGSTLQCTGASFVTTEVLPGDYVEIVGSGNTTPWSNNGYRWIVERVLGEDSLTVRPMSKAELSWAGTTVTDEQPIVDINIVWDGTVSLGSINIKSGLYCSGVSVIISPDIPTGASYSLWAFQPISDNSRPVAQAVSDSRVLQARDVTLTDSLPNGILSGCSVTTNPSYTTITIATGLIRWHGRVISAPATTILGSSLSSGITYYVYWDVTRGKWVTTSTGADVYGTTSKGLLIGTLIWNGTTLSVTSGVRTVLGEDPSITVGIGGQFTDLRSAVSYLNALALAGGDTASVIGASTHYEIVILSNTSVSSTITINCPSLTIRAINPSIKLIFTGLSTSPIFYPVVGNSSIIIKDMTVSCTNGSHQINSLISVAISASCVEINNVRDDRDTPVNMVTVVSDVGPYTGFSRTQLLTIKDCDLHAGQVADTSALYINIENCNFTPIDNGASANSYKLFLGTASSNDYNLKITNSRFNNYFASNTGTFPFLADIQGTTRDVLIENCRFDGCKPQSQDAIFLRVKSKVVFRNNYMSDTWSVILNNGGATGYAWESVVEGNHLMVCPASAAALSGITCGYAIGNTFGGSFASVSHLNTVMTVYHCAIGNSGTAVACSLIITPSNAHNTVISNNSLSLVFTSITVPTTPLYVLGLLGAGNTCTFNRISVVDTTASDTSFLLVPSTSSTLEIIGNVFTSNRATKVILTLPTVSTIQTVLFKSNVVSTPTGNNANYMFDCVNPGNWDLEIIDNIFYLGGSSLFNLHGADHNHLAKLVFSNNSVYGGYTLLTDTIPSNNANVVDRLAYSSILIFKDNYLEGSMSNGFCGIFSGNTLIGALVAYEQSIVQNSSITQLEFISAGGFEFNASNNTIGSGGFSAVQGYLYTPSVGYDWVFTGNDVIGRVGPANSFDGISCFKTVTNNHFRYTGAGGGEANPNLVVHTGVFSNNIVEGPINITGDGAGVTSSNNTFNSGVVLNGSGNLRFTGDSFTAIGLHCTSGISPTTFVNCSNSGITVPLSAYSAGPLVLSCCQFQQIGTSTLPIFGPVQFSDSTFGDPTSGSTSYIHGSITLQNSISNCYVNGDCDISYVNISNCYFHSVAVATTLHGSTLYGCYVDGSTFDGHCQLDETNVNMHGCSIVGNVVTSTGSADSFLIDGCSIGGSVEFRVSNFQLLNSFVAGSVTSGGDLAVSSGIINIDNCAITGNVTISNVSSSFFLSILMGNNNINGSVSITCARVSTNNIGATLEFGGNTLLGTCLIAMASLTVHNNRFLLTSVPNGVSITAANALVTSNQFADGPYVSGLKLLTFSNNTVGALSFDSDGTVSTPALTTTMLDDVGTAVVTNNTFQFRDTTGVTAVTCDTGNNLTFKDNTIDGGSVGVTASGTVLVEGNNMHVTTDINNSRMAIYVNQTTATVQNSLSISRNSIKCIIPDTTAVIASDYVVRVSGTVYNLAIKDNHIEVIQPPGAANPDADSTMALIYISAETIEGAEIVNNKLVHPVVSGITGHHLTYSSIELSITTLSGLLILGNTMYLLSVDDPPVYYISTCNGYAITPAGNLFPGASIPSGGSPPVADLARGCGIFWIIYSGLMVSIP